MYDKMIVCDISGTLLDNKGKFNNEIIEIIKILRENNIGFVLCSGGARIRTIELARTIGASKYVISSNGADVYDISDSKVIYNNLIDIETILKIFYCANKYDFRIAFNSDNYIYTNRLIYNTNYEKMFYDITKEFLISRKIVQCIVSGMNSQKFLHFLKEVNNISNITVAIKNISGKQNDINNIKMCYSDIVKCDTSKGLGLIKLCEHLDFDKKNIIAIGDSINDLSLFKSAGYCVAMGNAISELKNESDLVIRANDENGVCEYLKKLVKRM